MKSNFWEWVYQLWNSWTYRVFSEIFIAVIRHKEEYQGADSPNQLTIIGRMSWSGWTLSPSLASIQRRGAIFGINLFQSLSPLSLGWIWRTDHSLCSPSQWEDLRSLFPNPILYYRFQSQRIIYGSGIELLTILDYSIDSCWDCLICQLIHPNWINYLGA